MDASLFRNFKLTERFGMQFRAEVFDVLNLARPPVQKAGSLPSRQGVAINSDLNNVGDVRWATPGLIDEIAAIRIGDKHLLHHPDREQRLNQPPNRGVCAAHSVFLQIARDLAKSRESVPRPSCGTCAGGLPA